VETWTAGDFCRSNLSFRVLKLRSCGRTIPGTSPGSSSGCFDPTIEKVYHGKICVQASILSGVIHVAAFDEKIRSSFELFLSENSRRLSPLILTLKHIILL
jgi:hypothetical protein